MAQSTGTIYGKSKRGFLSKQGESNKGWKRRFILFENNALFYYKQEGDKDYAGVIFAEDMKNVSVNEEESKKNPKFPYCFDIESKDRTWMFAADSKAEMEDWIAFIRSVWDEVEQPSLEGGLQYATMESFITHGLRVNGTVEATVLAKLSEGATAKQKKKDARGWFCEKYVPPTVILSTMAEHGWKLSISYKTQGVLGDGKLYPANMMVFSRPYRK